MTKGYEPRSGFLTLNLGRETSTVTCGDGALKKSETETIS